MRRLRWSSFVILCLAGAACAPSTGPAPSESGPRDAAVSGAPCDGRAPPPQIRLTPAEIAALPHKTTAGGVAVAVLYGDPARSGLYTEALTLPAGFVLAAHTHEDTRTTTVISGTWHVGYGRKFELAQTKALPPGSLYSEPKAVAHFGTARDGPVVLYVTGCGPSNTVFVDPSPPRP